jgi:histidine triad (HIT) family protein
VDKCLFCKIINKELPAKLIYEDEDLIAFYDIYPKADVHFLVVPKKHIESMLKIEEHHQTLMGKIMLKANQIAKNLGLEGYKVQINTGLKGGQEVFHLHVHILGNK